MKSVAMVAALAMLQPPPAPSPFDQPMGELRGEKGDGVLDRLSLNQMMRLTALPPARLNEMKCAGVTRWSGSTAWPAFALTDRQRADFANRVASALAHDVEMDRGIAVGLINKFAEEPPYQQKQGKLVAWRAEMERDCAGLLARVRSGAYELAPLARPSVINPTLATCYARYTIAADAATDPAEATGLRATAAKAEALALAGKAGDALAAAKAALADRLALGRDEKMTGEGGEMMLVMCIPAMDVAARERRP